MHEGHRFLSLLWYPGHGEYMTLVGTLEVDVVIAAAGLVLLLVAVNRVTAWWVRRHG
jgi:uncharacterized membrane protein